MSDEASGFPPHLIEIDWKGMLEYEFTPEPELIDWSKPKKRKVQEDQVDEDVIRRRYKLVLAEMMHQHWSNSHQDVHELSDKYVKIGHLNGAWYLNDDSLEHIYVRHCRQVIYDPDHSQFFPHLCYQQTRENVLTPTLYSLIEATIETCDQAYLSGQNMMYYKGFDFDVSYPRELDHPLNRAMLVCVAPGGRVITAYGFTKMADNPTLSDADYEYMRQLMQNADPPADSEWED